MVETFGSSSHKHTRTHTHARVHHTVHTHKHAHMLACFCSPKFKGKKRKMTSSSSCEANETDGGGGENTGRNRTLLHKMQLGTDLLWALLPYLCVCVRVSVHMCMYLQAFSSVCTVKGLPNISSRSLPAKQKTEHYVTVQLEGFSNYVTLF